MAIQESISVELTGDVRYCVPIMLRSTVQPHASQSEHYRMSFMFHRISKSHASLQNYNRRHCVFITYNSERLK